LVFPLSFFNECVPKKKPIQGREWFFENFRQPFDRRLGGVIALSGASIPILKAWSSGPGFFTLNFFSIPISTIIYLINPGREYRLMPRAKTAGTILQER